MAFTFLLNNTTTEGPGAFVDISAVTGVKVFTGQQTQGDVLYVELSSDSGESVIIRSPALLETNFGGTIQGNWNKARGVKVGTKGPATLQIDI